MKRIAPVVAGVALAVAIVGGFAGVGRETAGGHDDAQSGGRIRWVNVSIDAPPEGSPVEVRRRFPVVDKSSAGLSDRFTIQLVAEGLRGEDGAIPALIVDAETGEVVSDTLTPTYPEAEALRASLALEGNLPKVWPFEPSPQPGERRTIGNVTVPVPPGESGLLITHVTSYCASDCEHIVIYYGRSTLALDAITGEVASHSSFAPELAAAFDRYAASVDVAPGTADATSRDNPLPLETTGPASAAP